MIVELTQTWFASTEKQYVDKIRVFSGRRYRPGVHKLDDRLYKTLPTSAKIIEPPKSFNISEPWKIKRKWDVDKEREISLEARAMDQYQAAHDQAEKTRKEARAKILEKARAAKALKKENESSETDETNEEN